MNRLLACLITLGTLCAIGTHAEMSIPFNASAESGIEVSADRWLDVVPALGYLPVALTIRNQTSSDGSWSLETTSRSMVYNSSGASNFATTLAVAGRQTGQFALLLPLASNAISTSSNLSATLTGPGLATTQNVFSNNYGTKSEFFGMSEELARNSWTPLETAWKTKTGSSSELFGSKLTLASAPRDWRGYTGLADLWLTADEWLALEPPVRQAMREWVMTGGRIYLFEKSGASHSPEQLQLPAPTNGHRWLGFGEIIPSTWDGTKLDENAALERIQASENAWATLVQSAYQHGWALREMVGSFQPSSGFVIGITLLFAIVAGPLNLFWFAPAGRRHRLFWTTPLLTVAATLSIVIFSIVRDGVGGTGARFILAVVLPGEHQIAVLQEQVSKTGILLRSSFPITENYLMLPLSLGEKRDEKRQITETPTTRGGWFASRSVQAQLLKTVRSTRGGLTVTMDANGEHLSVTSSFDMALKNVFIEVAGLYWTTRDLKSGEKQPFTKSSESDFRNWLKSANAPAGQVIGRAIEATSTPIKLVTSSGVVVAHQRFYATVAEPEKLAIATSPDIRWKHQTAICTGEFNLVTQP